METMVVADAHKAKCSCSSCVQVTELDIELAQTEWFKRCAVKHAERAWDAYMDATMRARDAYMAYERASADVAAGFKDEWAVEAHAEFIARDSPSEHGSEQHHIWRHHAGIALMPDFVALDVGAAHQQQLTPRVRATPGARPSPVTVASLGLKAPWMVRQMPTPPRKCEGKSE